MTRLTVAAVGAAFALLLIPVSGASAAPLGSEAAQSVRGDGAVTLAGHKHGHKKWWKKKHKKHHHHHRHHRHDRKKHRH